MDLHQLRLFAAIFEKGTLSGAAEHRRIAVSALSHHLNKLEEELETPLFTRLPRGVKPTAAGERLYRHALEILRAVEDAKDDLRAASGTISGSIRLGVAATWLAALAGPLLAEAQKTLPDVRVSLVENVTGSLFTDRLEDDVDLALVFNPTPDPRFRATPLLHEEMYCLADSRFLKSSDQPISLNEILELPLILPPRGEPTHTLSDDLGVLRKIEQNASHTFQSVQAIREAVFAGIGATISSPLLYRNDLRTQKLTTRRIGAPGIVRTLYLCEATDKPATFVQEAFKTILHRETTQAVESGHWPNARLAV